VSWGDGTIVSVSARVDLYSTYRHFTDPVSDAIRAETFGVDIGQNSWITVDEFDRFISWLGVASNQHVLEIASGSGGPALHLAHTTGCRLTGIDSNEGAVVTAYGMAGRAGLADRVQFNVADANVRLPVDDGAFDAILCIDAMNHLPDRLAVLREWHRVLRAGAKALFTDPVVVTGPVTSDELAMRSSIGVFLFGPPGMNERLIEQAGFHLIRQEDVSANAALVAERWRDARQAHRDQLLKIEGEERFDGLQRFFEAVRTLTSQRRLSRIAYLVQKPEE
jgi:SAM-dependent methyltransferase